jgi:tetratricopeptide (TPR) repeat protein
MTLTVAQTQAQTMESKLVDRRQLAQELAQLTLDRECFNLNMNSDSGQTTDAEFEVEAKQMLARVGDAENYDFCKGMTLSYLSLALLKQQKLDEARKAASKSIDLLQHSAGRNDILLRQSIGVLASIAIEHHNLAEVERQAIRLHPLAATEKALALECGLLMDIAFWRQRLDEAVRLGKETIAHWDRTEYKADASLEHDLIGLGTALVLSNRAAEAIPFVNRAVVMSEQIPAFSEHARANALMGVALWKAGHGASAAEPYFKRALYWIDRVPRGQMQQVGREVYGVYLDYLNRSGRRQEAKRARVKLNSFGPDPAQWVVDYSGLRLSKHD